MPSVASDPEMASRARAAFKAPRRELSAEEERRFDQVVRVINPFQFNKYTPEAFEAWWSERVHALLEDDCALSVYDMCDGDASLEDVAGNVRDALHEAWVSQEAAEWAGAKCAGKWRVCAELCIETSRRGKEITVYYVPGTCTKFKEEDLDDGGPDSQPEEEEDLSYDPDVETD